MQHPTGYEIGPNGEILLSSFWKLLLDHWALWQLAHTMVGAVQTGFFAMAAVGAFYLLARRSENYGRMFVKSGVIVGTIAALLQLSPTGYMQGRLIAQNQPPTLAAMEGLFTSQSAAPLAILGQPDLGKQRPNNPLVLPSMLSFLTYRSWTADVKGLDSFPHDQWPDQVVLLYYCYHLMVGLGTIFIAVMGLAAWLLWRGGLCESPLMAWGLVVSRALPLLASTTGGGA